MVKVLSAYMIRDSATKLQTYVFIISLQLLFIYSNDKKYIQT